jgi:nitrous oxidase accessory protein NosD
MSGVVSANLIQENHFTGNSVGIQFRVGATGLTPTANTFVENTIAMSTCGVQGPVSDNAFTENLLLNNAADHCP